MKNPLSILLKKHQRIDAALRQELARPAPDIWRIQSLKKLKLAIKDRLASLADRRSVTP